MTIFQQPLMGGGVIIVQIDIEIDMQRFDSNHITPDLDPDPDPNPDFDFDFDFDFSRLFSNAVPLRA